MEVGAVRRKLSDVCVIVEPLRKIVRDGQTSTYRRMEICIMEGLTVAERSRLLVVTIEQVTKMELANESPEEIHRVSKLVVERLASLVASTDRREQLAVDENINCFCGVMTRRLWCALHGCHDIQLALAGALGIIISARVFPLDEGSLVFVQLDAGSGQTFQGVKRANDAIELPDSLQSIVRDSTNLRLKRAWRLAQSLRAGGSLDDPSGVTSRQKVPRRKRIKVLEFDGKRMTVSEWGKIIGLDAGTIHERLRKGWSIDRVLSPPTRIRRSVNVNTEAETVDNDVPVLQEV